MFESKNFRIITSRNHQNQYFEKILRKRRQNFIKNLKNGHKNAEKTLEMNFERK